MCVAQPVILASFHDWLERWAPLADWAVAVGTLALAIATGWLAKQARREATEVKNQADAVAAEADAVQRQAAAVAEQVTIGREQLDASRRQLEASQRPFVLPTMEWWKTAALGAPTAVSLLNAGSGPAYNLHCALFWQGGIGGGARTQPIVIPAGESATATLLPSSVQDLRIPWGQVSGYILYTDLARTEWQTHFRYRMELSNTPWVDVVWVGKTSELGEPDYTLEEGWRNRPDHLKPVAPVAPTSGAGTD